MSKKQVLIMLAVLVLAVAGLAAFKPIFKNSPALPNKQAEEQAAAKLRLVLIQDAEDINFLADYAKDKGFFNRNGLEVEFLYVDKNPIGLVEGGQADVILGGLSRPLALYFNNAEARLIFNAARPFGFFGISRFAKDKITSVKKAAVNSFAGEGQLITVNALKAFGVGTNEVEFVALPGNLAKLSQLEKKEIDFAVFNSEKFVYENNLSQAYTIYEPSEIITGELFIRSAATTDKVIKEKPAELYKFTSAMFEALEEMSANQSAVTGYVQEKYGLSAERAENFYRRLSAAKAGVSFEPKSESLLELAEMVKKESDIESDRSLEDFIYTDFARQAATAGAK